MAVKKKVAKKKVAKKKVAKKKAAAKTSTEAPVVTSKITLSNKYPKTSGAIADALYKQDQKIKKINDQLKAEQAIKAEMEEQAFNIFKKDGLESARGKVGLISVTRTNVPTVENPTDWEEVFKYILKKKDFAVLQKRLAVTHVRDLMADGINIKGITIFPKVSMSVRKSGK